MAAWLDELGLIVRDGVAVSAEEGPVFVVDGPREGGVHAGVLAERPDAVWRTTVVLEEGGEPPLVFSRAFAFKLAEACGGAVYDPQFERLLWPRAAPAPPPEGVPTTRVVLSWFLAPARWPEAPQALMRAIARACPEALPAHFGRYEPPEHAYHPAAFARFSQDERGLWRSAPPSLGGRWTVPEDGNPARLDMAFDGRALDGNPVLREAVARLFAEAAADLGAFFACAQVEPGWVETAAGQLLPTPKARLEGNSHILHGMEWQGLPPVPMWLSWFGSPYRDLVAPHLPAHAYVAPQPEGVLVRLGAEARPARDLGEWPLPPELTFRHRPAYRARPDGSMSSDLPVPEDRAAVIPPLT